MNFLNFPKKCFFLQQKTIDDRNHIWNPIFPIYDHLLFVSGMVLCRSLSVVDVEEWWWWCTTHLTSRRFPKWDWCKTHLWLNVVVFVCVKFNYITNYLLEINIDAIKIAKKFVVNWWSQFSSSSFVVLLYQFRGSEILEFIPVFVSLPSSI